MLHVLLILIIAYVSAQTSSLSNETLLEIHKINELGYSYEIKVTGSRADLTFTISNTTYAIHVLHIVTYYFSITFIGEEYHEVRTELGNLTTNETIYHDTLKMSNLEEKGYYFVCVFFQNSLRQLIGSSRFCHVVSVSEHCKIEASKGTSGNRQIYVLLPFVVFILVVSVLFTFIRDYIYRPRTIDALLKTLPQHHAENLEKHASVADTRRRRRTQPALNSRLRQDSVLSAEYDPDADHEYYNYHGIDNASLETVPE